MLEFSSNFYSFSSIIQAANDCDLEPVAYEFFTQAFIIYEEDISVNINVFFIIQTPQHKSCFSDLALHTSSLYFHFSTRKKMQFV